MESNLSCQSGSTQSTDETPKLLIQIQSNGSVVGDNYAKWSTRTGHFIRGKIPINIKDWRRVPQNFKDDVWNALTSEFEFNIHPKLARPLLEKVFPQRFRTMKALYRKQLLRNAESMQEAITTCPLGINPGQWADFVTREFSPEVKEANQKNKQNREKNAVGHTLGRCSYAQKHREMQKQNPKKVITRVEPWLKGHERNDGTVLESAKEKYELVKAATERKRKNSSICGESSSSHVDLDSDELTEVFGAENGRSVRGVGSHISKKQLQQVAVAEAVLEESKSSSYAEVKAEVTQVKTEVTEVKTLLKVVLEHVRPGSVGCQIPPTEATTPRAEIGSNSIDRPSLIGRILESLNPPSRSSTTSKVVLLDRNGTRVAKGYVVTNQTSGIYHGRSVGLGEKKVYVEEVLVGTAPLYDWPQDGHSIMEGYIEGGYLIWLEARLEFV